MTDRRPPSSGFLDFSEHLRAALDAPLPGHSAHARMAPSYRDKREKLTIEGKDCREAAVLALLVPLDADDRSVDRSRRNPHPPRASPVRPVPARIVLTVRRSHLAAHAGQISFPGGRREPGESLLETALRETQEEVGVCGSDIEALGALTPLFIPPSGYCVHPFVGWCTRPEFTAQEEEVERLLLPRMDQLLWPGARTVEERTIGGRKLQVPFYQVGSEKVWGATAMMLSELLAVIGVAT